jgi:ribonuclease D
VDRPPFKVLGNRTLLEISEQKPRKLDDLARIKGVTELIVRRLGRELMAAVRLGRKTEHGPIPKLPGNSRRRMDRAGERRVVALKKWRGTRAVELSMDPGVLCPNSSLEAIAWCAPKTRADLEGVPELKNWFVREFGGEVTRVSQSASTEDAG